MAEKPEKDSYAMRAIPKLDGYYEHWKILMENLLRSKDYWEVVENGVPPVTATSTVEETKAHNEAKMKDLKARNYLYQAIDRNTLETILKHDSSKEIWDSLQQKFLGSKKVKQAQLQVLRKEFEVLEMKEGEAVNDFFARTLTIAKKMKRLGEELKEVTVVEKILRSMTMKFNYVVCSIVQANDIESLTIDSLQSTILVEEQRMKGQKEDEQVMKVNTNTTRGRGRGRGAGRGRGRSKENVECYKCHKLGHYQYECPNAEGNEANFADYEEEEEILLMASCDDEKSCGTSTKSEECLDLDTESNFHLGGILSEELLMTQSDNPQATRESIWFLDSGCSTHMCGSKKWFFTIDESFKESVKVGDGRKLKVEGKGTLKLRIESKVQVITDVSKE